MSNPILPEMVTCPHCGTQSPGGRALCANCQSPLTAYGGQVKGEAESVNWKLAKQVGALERRPPTVTAVAVCDVLFALFWPLAYVIGAFAGRQQVNSEGTNYIASAVGVVGPILAAIILIPIALGILAAAWAAWTQSTWAWSANLAVLALFAATIIAHFSAHGALSYLWLALAAVLAILWLRPQTKSWFGIT